MNIAVILISGNGKRFGGDTPKQFIEVNHRPVYLYTVDRFYHSNKIDKIVLVTSPNYIDSVKKDLDKYTFKNIDVILGGSERYLSVKNAISYISSFANEKDKVLIHDGVRACVSESIIEDNIKGLDTYNATLTAIEGDFIDLQKVRIDTVHKKDGLIYLAQTPQSFRFGYIKQLIELYKNEPVTDEIRYVEANNDDYLIVSGDKTNFKITDPSDLIAFKQVIKPVKKYKAYLFDFDGTLIDSRDSLFLVYQKAFEAVGVKISKEEVMIFMKEAIEKTFKRKIANPKEGQLELYCDIINSYINEEKVTKENKLFYDTIDIVNYIKDNNLLCGLISGNDSLHMKEVLTFLGIDTSLFKCYIGHAEVEHFKPHPEGIFKAIKCLGEHISLDDVCYVGDSLGDMMAAFNAGITGYLIDRNNEYPLSNTYIKLRSLKDLI